MSRRVESFYDRISQDEWTRMDRHRMEFRTTLRAMSEFIPPRSTILDIGGGPGRYSIELAKAGHRVTLLDLSSQNVELARQKAREMGVEIATFVHGNALDLSRFADSALTRCFSWGRCTTWLSRLTVTCHTRSLASWHQTDCFSLRS